MSNTRILRRSLALIATACSLLAASAASAADQFTVVANANSSAGGTALSTGLSFAAGQLLRITVDPSDIWGAGAPVHGKLWSNADGLVTDLFATGSDESGFAAGTHIGAPWPNPWTQNGFTAPFGSLVGKIGSSFFLVGTNFQGAAPEAGKLQLMYWDQNAHDNLGSVAVTVSVVPEPASGIMAGMGLVMLCLIGRTRRRGAAAVSRVCQAAAAPGHR